MINSSFCIWQELETSTTLEKFLTDYLQISKNQIKKFVGKNERFKVVQDQEQIITDINLLNFGLVNPNYQGGDVTVLFEDDEFLVIEKPPGVHTHSLTYTEQDNCLSALRSLGYGRYLYGHQQQEKGFLYRLDKETSGVLVYVKSPQLHIDLRDKFSEVVVTKKYHALVEGNFKHYGVIEHFVKPFGVKGSFVKVVDKSDGSTQKIEAEFKQLEFSDEHNHSLVEVKLKTGYRHQIRVQLAALGFPIIGDKKYGGKDANRLMLHAVEYELLYEDRKISFQTKLSLK